MNEIKRTPFRKNLDKRYISGEDLKNGIALGKGLRPEMVVTLAKFNDANAFDQKTQSEISKTAIWMKEYPSGKMIYKPCLLNVTRSEFMSEELANNSLFLDDCDLTKPFVMYAKTHKRHAFVVEFKKYLAPNPASPEKAIIKLNACKTLAELKTVFGGLTSNEQILPSVVALKDKLKVKLV